MTPSEAAEGAIGLTLLLGIIWAGWAEIRLYTKPKPRIWPTDLDSRNRYALTGWMRRVADDIDGRELPDPRDWWGRWEAGDREIEREWREAVKRRETR